MSSPNLIQAAITETLKRNVRKLDLDVRMHFLPINMGIYRMTLENLLLDKEPTALDDDQENFEINAGVEPATIEKIIQEITKFVKNTHKNPAIDITNPEQWKDLISLDKERKSSSIDKKLPACLYQGNPETGNLIGVLYGSYNKAREGIFKTFFRNTVVKYLRRDAYIKRKAQKALEALQGKKVAEGDIPIGLDVGHIAGMESYTISPLLEKINLLDKQLDSLISAGQDQNSVLAGIRNGIEAAKNDLLNQSTYGQDISFHLTKETTSFLTSVGAVLVIPQDALENRFFYGTKIEKVIYDQIEALLLTVNFSRNMLEEIGYKVTMAIKDTKPTVSKKHKTKEQLLKIDNLIPKIKTTLTATSGKKYVKPAKIVKKKVTAKTTNLTSLQNLINASLVERVKANMGRGERRDVLNLRTGRFAESVKVERMSQSREGMITAFYSYMKNPYATFSQGGRQQSPKSRDPKLLISKSIREIATQQVANRLRSVNI